MLLQFREQIMWSIVLLTVAAYNICTILRTNYCKLCCFLFVEVWVFAGKDILKLLNTAEDKR